MTDRGLGALFFVFLVTGTDAAPAQETFSFAYLQRAEDSFYAPHRAYTGLTLRDRHRPLDGARTAVREGRILGRMLGLRFELEQRSLEAGDNPMVAIEALQRELGAKVFLLDLPLADFEALKPALSLGEIIFFNVRHGDDRLRGSDCAAALFHTLPSDAMLMDALAQFLFKKDWRKVLLLVGEEDADRRLSDAFTRSAQKFRIEIVEQLNFVLSNDPRQRDQNNVALLTGGKKYDVVFVSDSVGEFGRYVPYNVREPRPVIGSEGLSASAWHWTWERHGAPQLNQRFDRIAKRRMQAVDYAGWAAVRSVIEAVVRTESTDVTTLRAYLSSDEFIFDAYKGAPASFRPWDLQMRQPILLHTENAVIERAPVEGFLHEKNNLDTLGQDERESACRM
ncbi:MAG TPA: amino acid ABC transporter substrate-binding protein [Gammaproteobacteria bacterium]|nr:amino acid ABC transporter substrate-binding protein [Gammaproteobacteria bacterium]